MTKETNTTPLSHYEHTAMWMSYRYAIGRHTAAASGHAGDLVQANYYRLTEEQKELNSYDMRREINQCLWAEFNFTLDLYVPQEVYDPFKAMLKYFDIYFTKDTDLAEYFSKHRVCAEYEPVSKKYYYVTEDIKDGGTKSISNIADLIEWANAANALDKKTHYIVVTDDGEIEVFEKYVIKNWKTLEMELCSIDDYLESPIRAGHISRDNIKELKPLEEKDDKNTK